MEPWAACVAGVFGALAFVGWSYGLFYARIDDPTDSVAGKEIFD